MVESRGWENIIKTNSKSTRISSLSWPLSLSLSLWLHLYLGSSSQGSPRDIPLQGIFHQQFWNPRRKIATPSLQLWKISGKRSHRNQKTEWDSLSPFFWGIIVIKTQKLEDTSDISKEQTTILACNKSSINIKSKDNEWTLSIRSFGIYEVPSWHIFSSIIESLLCPWPQLICQTVTSRLKFFDRRAKFCSHTSLKTPGRASDRRQKLENTLHLS